MQDLEKIGQELEKRGMGDKIKKLAQSREGQQLSRMVDAAAVESAARSGDTDALKRMLSQVLSTDEGKKLAESVRMLMQDK